MHNPPHPGPTLRGHGSSSEGRIDCDRRGAFVLEAPARVRVERDGTIIARVTA